MFLDRFFPKLEIWGIFFLNREKNFEALKALGITPTDRVNIIHTIEVNDYVETIEDTINQFGEMWVFGKDVNKREVYIKIAYGQPNRNAICVSFHLASEISNEQNKSEWELTTFHNILFWKFSSLLYIIVINHKNITNKSQ